MIFFKKLYAGWVYSLLSVFILLSIDNKILAQELICGVSVNAPAIQGIDQSILKQFSDDITQYMNARKWTNEKFEPNEKIKCYITINITTLPNSSRFEGTASIRVIRPVYNSGYESLIFTYNDKDFKANYVPFQPLEYSENVYTSNLTSILNFYAFTILGLDYSCMSPNGGIPYFQKAREVVNLAVTANESGWRSQDSRECRYWLAENLLNSSYGAIHTVFYKYHREGLDAMEKDVNSGRAKVLESIEDLKKLYAANPNIFIVQSFMDAKKREIIDMFKKAFPDEKTKLLNATAVVDANANYDEINKE